MSTTEKGHGKLHCEIEAAYQALKRISQSRDHAKKEHTDLHGIYSDSTRQIYVKDRWHPMVDFLADKFGVRHIYDIEDYMVADWHRMRIDKKLAASTINVDVSATGMLGHAITAFCKMNGHEKVFDFPSRFSVTREAIKNRINQDAWEHRGRAYERPLELAQAMDNEVNKSQAYLQMFCGMRAEGAGSPRNTRAHTVLTIENFEGKMRHPLFKKVVVGCIAVTEKGGKKTPHYCPEWVYDFVLDVVKRNGGKICVNYYKYRKAVIEAAKRTGQYVLGRGTHGLKHSFVENFIANGIRFGLSQEAIFAQCSRECGHERIDIIPKHYLGR